MSRFLIALCVSVCFVFSPCALRAAESGEQDRVWLFSYFVGNGEDGLRLLWSRDGMNWNRYREGRSLLQPMVGQTEQLMRDPSIVQGPDGTFHMVWSVSWVGHEIGYASSPDLLNWSEQRAIPVMAHEPTARNSWAPELFYDEVEEQFYIIWASTIPGRFPETAASSETEYNHRQYYTTTKDFKTFAPTALYFDPGHNVIDAYLTKHDGKYFLFYKDETLYPAEKKNIVLAIGPTPRGPFEPQGVISHDNWVEGPTAFRMGGNWIVYYDCYREGKFGAVRSSDGKNWENITPKISVPREVRHGTIFSVDFATFQRLMEAE